MEHSTTDQYPSSKCISEAHEAFYKTILKRFKWSTKSNSIRSCLKDISEAPEVFYKLMKGHLMLAWFLKEKQKHKGRKSCEQNKTRGIPIIVEEERWDANWGIPKLRCLSTLWIFTWGALGIPKLELLPLFILLILIAPRPSDTSSTQNFNKNLWDPLV